MKCLVTGSSGFIGSHLVKALQKEGHEVGGIDIKQPILHSTPTKIVDISSNSNVIDAIAGVDFVFHLAGLLGTHELIDNSYKAVVSNIGGTVNVLEACKKSGAKMILASKPNCWLNTYTITKEAAESFAKMYMEEHGVDIAILKWFNVYGPAQPLMKEMGYKKFIPHAIVDALNGRPIEIYGTGNQTVDLVHTDDTVSAALAVMNNWDKCKGLTFEVGHHEVTVNTVSNMLLDLASSKSGMKYFPMRKGEKLDTKISANTNMLRQLSGWMPKISLQDGLKNTVDWYRKNKV